MSEAADKQEKTQEIVGVVADRKQFQRAVDSLLAAGFKRTDLSVLASHESLDVSDTAEHGLKETFTDTLQALVGEVKYAGPLGAAGIAVLFGGPIGFVVGGAVAAGIGGLALKEVLDEVLSHPDTEDFSRAVEAGGIILWVGVKDKARAAKAKEILHDAKARNIHTIAGR